MFELFAAGTGNGRRAAIMLEECGLEFKMHEMDFVSGRLQSPEFLELNPQGAIPVLIHHVDGERRVIPQSGAILLYLAELTGRFLPSAGAARARTLTRFFTAQTDAASTSSGIFYATVAPDKSAANDEFYRARFMKVMSLANHWLSEGAYIAGEEVTVADFALIPIVSQRASLITGSDLSHLKKWLAGMSERPGTKNGLSI